MNYLPERDLIIFLLRREFYEQYFSSIDLKHIKDLYKELYHVYVVLQELHEKYQQDFNLDELQATFFTKYPDVDKDIYLGLFKTLSETKIEEGVGVGILKDIKRRKQALKLSEEAFKVSTGSGDINTVKSLMAEIDDSGENTTEEFEFVSTKLSVLVHKIYQGKGLHWRLQALNVSLGPLRKANFGFIFARPETGKTTLIASEGTCMASQLTEEDGPVLWLNNEQEGGEVMLRVYQAHFGITLEQLLGNVPKYEAQFEREIGSKFLLKDEANLTRNYIETLCRQFKPSLIIIDQIDKIKGFDSDREDLRLGAIYIWARELAKQYCPVIGICQADGTAEGQKWLTMDNVSNAKTSKQAEADWILGMGKTHAEGAEYIRYFNISKNKLLGDEDTIPHMRHARMEVLIQPEIARFKDLINYD